jgi:hypothetical protein
VISPGRGHYSGGIHGGGLNGGPGNGVMYGDDGNDEMRLEKGDTTNPVRHAVRARA